MSVMIQIRNVPEEIHRRLKVRAAESGQTLSDFLLEEIKTLAELPTLEEMRARLESRASVHLDISPAEILREERDKR